MDPMEKYLSDYENTEKEREFRLIPCDAKQYFITLSLLGVILILMILLVIFTEMELYMLIYAILMSILVIFVTPILWNKVFQNFIKNSLVPAMSAIEEKQNQNVLEYIRGTVGKFLGIRFSPDLIYFLEADPQDIDLTKNKQLMKYSFDVTTTALGFSFIATMVVSWFLNITASNWYVLLYLGVGFAFGSPLLISPLIPIIWTLEGTSVKSIDKHHQIQRLGYRIRERIFDRFMGKGGIILGFSFILNNITKLNEELQIFTSFAQFLWTLVIFFSMILMMGLPCVLSTMRYFRLHHGENVNLTRNILKTVLPIGYTVVKAKQKEDN